MIDAWVAAGALAPVDVHLARRLGRLGEETRPEVLLGVALASRALQRGHVCLPVGAPDLAALVGAEAEGPSPPEADAWLAALRSSPLVGDGDAGRPLVLDGRGRLYLRRYFEYEQRLARAIRERLAPVAYDAAVLRAGLARLFPAGPELDWQRVAAIAAVTRRFTVISGGPGTGKTHTAAAIVRLLEEQAAAAGLRPPRIAALAPTGKAAQRLEESIARDTSTVHRALEASADGSRFGRGPDRRLEAEVVIVDEASMVDLGLMVRLVQALPDDARLVLLGDRDQLASVEAGAVLGDICAGAEIGRLSRAFAARVAALSGDVLPLAGSVPADEGMCDAVITLRHSRRYASEGGIGSLARAVQAGDADAALAVLAAGGVVRRVEPARDANLPPELLKEAREVYGRLLDTDDPRHAHEVLASFRILCAHRRGPGGVERVNDEVRETFPAARASGPYAGQPILITRNDVESRLSNGDVGVLQRDGDRLVAAFLDPDGSVRRLSPALLPAHEPVYAMSVHKSQGSELEHVVVVLPQEPSPVVTRELLYTAITRARDRVTVVATEAVLRHACTTRVRRASGLADALWRTDGA